MPYNYSIEHIIEGTPEEVGMLEIKYIRENQEHHYSPKIKFGGSLKECFSEIKGLTI